MIPKMNEYLEEFRGLLSELSAMTMELISTTRPYEELDCRSRIFALIERAKELDKKYDKYEKLVNREREFFTGTMAFPTVDWREPINGEWALDALSTYEPIGSEWALDALSTYEPGGIDEEE